MSGREALEALERAVQELGNWDSSPVSHRNLLAYLRAALAAAPEAPAKPMWTDNLFYGTPPDGYMDWLDWVAQGHYAQVAVLRKDRFERMKAAAPEAREQWADLENLCAWRKWGREHAKDALLIIADRANMSGNVARMALDKMPKDAAPKG